MTDRCIESLRVWSSPELSEALWISLKKVVDVDASSVQVKVFLQLGEGGVRGQRPASVHVDTRNNRSNFRNFKKVLTKLGLTATLLSSIYLSRMTEKIERRFCALL